MKTLTRLLLLLAVALPSFADSKPKLTLDDFFNSVGYTSVELSPDGENVVVGTERADWDQQIFRKDLWLYRIKGDGGSLIQLTQSGHDSEPKWSPDGRWIAFLSERKPAAEKDSDSSGNEDDDKGKEGTAQVYVISPSGGEAIQLTEGEEEVHSFSWSADSRTIYFATRQPWTKTQKDDYKKQWKDVVQYRTAERGDTIFALSIESALSRNLAASETSGNKEEKKDDEKQPDATLGAREVASLPLRVDEMVTSPDGVRLAILSNAINQRQEKVEDVEFYVVVLASPPASGSSGIKPATPRRLTHNQAVEAHPRWANDSRHIFFEVEVGDVTGPYRDLQPHLYWVDSETGAVEQWSKDFNGEITHYAVASNTILTAGRLGTEIPMYTVNRPSDSLHKLNSWPGTYELISTTQHSPRVAFIYSTLQKPTEVYLAESSDKLAEAKPITNLNGVLADRDLPQGKPYLWKADDGTTVEGMLIYPPGKFEQKNLPMFTFIHGGPADADGNHFEADWYQWAALAATNGWLVFEPNYRGSTGYGDKFLMQIVPQIVSRPGKDILEGVDALVKDGIADPNRLTVGGYSYGGYMTNWLITQSTRWKAAVTGAGAVEHIGNWGNDDTTMDDAYFLGGRPWEAPQRYHDEAAIFQIDKVRTPTHMVGGADDIRVAVLEDYLLEHALYSLGIPNALLIFPGEGHSLDKNPWHGKIKVREELKWLQKYGEALAGN
ncbi:MAG TPA: prolyl oligopeptidase family serine peptidase [Candidatus Sulfotelmatobacter sp.]|jgi:dipeptidyl aminopeptidase/acylaminoacyl peptidase